MNQSMKIDAIVKAFNALEVECFYSGVRFDVMLKSKIFGSEFNDLFNLLSFNQLGNGLVIAYFDGI